MEHLEAHEDGLLKSKNDPILFYFMVSTNDEINNKKEYFIVSSDNLLPQHPIYCRYFQGKQQTDLYS